MSVSGHIFAELKIRWIFEDDSETVFLISFSFALRMAKPLWSLVVLSAER